MRITSRILTVALLLATAVAAARAAPGTILDNLGCKAEADRTWCDVQRLGGGYGEFSARKEADLHFIRVGTERYEIPDAVVFGG